MVLLLALTWHFNAKPRHEIFSAAPDALRALAATVVVFGIGGFGLVRLLLPAAAARATSCCGCCPPAAARPAWR